MPNNIEFHEIENIIKYRCGVCHANKPTFEGYEEPQLGVIFDTAEDILKHLQSIKAQSLDSDVMPPGNITGMTKSERDKIRKWIKMGAIVNQ